MRLPNDEPSPVARRHELDRCLAGVLERGVDLKSAGGFFQPQLKPHIGTVCMGDGGAPKPQKERAHESYVPSIPRRPRGLFDL